MKCLACVVAVVIGMPVSAAVVYDNTSQYTGTENALLAPGLTHSGEHGNEVTLVGTERLITKLRVYLRIGDFGPATFDIRARFYANDGPGGEPGTQLWESPLVPALIDSGAPLLYTIDVPSVEVPDTFTWTIQLSDRVMNMAALGPSQFDPPTVGAAPFGYWRRPVPAHLAWEYAGLDEAPFGARIEADAAPCLADLDASGDVGFGDVLEVFAAWGPCAGACPEDLSGNGLVDFADILALIAAWGPC